MDVPDAAPEHLVPDPPHHTHTSEVCATCGAGWVVADDDRTLVMQHAEDCVYIAVLQDA